MTAPTFKRLCLVRVTLQPSGVHHWCVSIDFVTRNGSAATTHEAWCAAMATARRLASER